MSEKDYYPPMHTAEHILNQTMIRIFGCSRSFSAHIERKKSKCDYKILEQPSEEKIKDIERVVNEVINKNLYVTERYVTKEEAKSIVDVSKLPQEAGESIRIISIGDYDDCACIGPHVKSTLEIGQFFITTYSYDDGILRLRFKISNS